VTAMFDPRVTMIELPPLKDGLRHYARELRRSLAQELATPDEDVRVHLHSSKAGFLGRVAMMGLPQPKQLLYSPHGLVFLNKRWIAPSLVFRALEWLAARVVRSTPVGCGRSEADLLTRISPTPAVVLENAVDNVFFGIQRQLSEPPVVASMGRICYQKAPEQFAEMAVRFEIAGLKARFVWIGSGEPAQEARLRAAGVTVTGWVDRDEIRRWLAECAVYVQTSRWEGMPLSVLQALAAGVPCVVTDVVGNRDAVRQGITGFVADTPESMLIALRRLLQDEELHARMSAAAQADAHERFSNASFRERLLQLYGIAPEPVAKNVVNILRPAAPSTPAPKPSGLAAAPRVVSRG
jgi:glycosyltransferase involved in cell wall biosynthesis